MIVHRLKFTFQKEEVFPSGSKELVVNFVELSKQI